MIICTNCGQQNREGDLFCLRCGVALTAISVGTKRLEDEEDDLQPGGDQLDSDAIIFLHIHGHADPVTVRISDRIILGRAGGELGDTLHLNLDPYDAEGHGVSRRHAIFTRDGNHLLLADLNSTNSTYINQKRLSPNEYVVVHDGDEIRLGHMSMRLFFK